MAYVLSEKGALQQKESPVEEPPSGRVGYVLLWSDCSRALQPTTAWHEAGGRLHYVDHDLRSSCL